MIRNPSPSPRKLLSFFAVITVINSLIKGLRDFPVIFRNFLANHPCTCELCLDTNCSYFKKQVIAIGHLSCLAMEKVLCLNC